MITFKPLKSAGGSARREVHTLLRELSDSAAKKFSAPTLARALRDANTYILTAHDGGAIVGTGTLIVMATATGLRGRIEDVVVADSHRGQGIGRELMRRLIAEAMRRKLTQVELTSAPARVAANHLYQSLGFALRETNVYKLVLPARK